MDVFVIHSGSDAEYVAERLSELKKTAHGFNPLLLSSGDAFKKEKKLAKNKKRPKAEKKPKVEKKTDKATADQDKKKFRIEIPFWKISARRKIKKAQMVIFFVGEKSHDSKYIEWEINKAIKFEKPIYTIKLNEDYELHKALETVDEYSGEKGLYSKTVDFEEMLEIIKKHENGDYKVFNQDIESIDKAILLEQYKVFLQTSEDLVSRRQNVNNFYISINSALMAAFGLIWALEILPTYKFFIGALLSVVGIILSLSWIKLLASYGDLNSSKMKIISYIERQLPASLYDAEWAALSDKLNKRKYVSFTNSEKKVPLLFIIVYACVSICSVAFLF
ncbi:MAG: TIR domain-containing protein [Clostridia bacterium]|nr:TIR domain-containing protein [Clostridia bacterium]